jgi:hypothetical protein
MSGIGYGGEWRATVAGQLLGAQPSELGPQGVAGVVSVADLARLLRQLRRRQARQGGEATLTYRELAAKTGWSRGVIGEYFAGNVLPPTDRFRRADPAARRHCR